MNHSPDPGTVHHPVVIIGAGPAGLTAAHELAKKGKAPLVLEASGRVGGLARTETYKGFRFDIGGHRFFTQVEEVQRMWDEMMGGEFQPVRRISFIYFRNRFFKYPFRFFNVLMNLGIRESTLIFLSYLKAKFRPFPREENFEQWTVNRFGRRLYQTFFRSYTEKVWGIPCRKIQADWAAQRINGMSLSTAICNAVFGSGNLRTLTDRFYFPALGAGEMWRRFREALENRGGRVLLHSEVIRINRRGNKISTVTVGQGSRTLEVAGDQFISSMPLGELVLKLQPPPPGVVTRAAGNFFYRAFILVGLILNRKEVFPAQWIYVHNSNVRVGRIQNFKNWSPHMVPDPEKTGLGMEYFCDEGDGIWSLSDEELIRLAVRELVDLGLAVNSDVEDAVVFRQPKAYPVYDPGYRDNVKIVRQYLAGIENLQTIGRNGLHRYNNQDHSMLTGILAARNIDGEKEDVWEVNTRHLYLEQDVLK